MKLFLAAAIVAMVSSGCVLDRSGIGTCASGLCGDAGNMGDAWVEDGNIPDAGHDAFVVMSDAGDAGEPVDAFVEPDAFVEVDAFVPPVDAGLDAFVEPDAFVPPVDGGPPGAVVSIVMHGAVGTEGIGYIVTNNRTPPNPPLTYGPFFDGCWGGITHPDATSVACDASYVEIRSGSIISLFPIDTGTHASLCDRTTCPGTYVVTYLGGGVTPVTLIPDGYDQNSDGFGDHAVLQFRMP
ncbi:MAG: hypothetical protein WCK01_05395 [Candidatus Uhrbacteria bacterium]